MSENLFYKSMLARSMALCAGREMCKIDIEKKLGSWGVEKNDVDKILDQLAKEKFIDEERYAGAFVKDKFRYNKWGKIKIVVALRVKKIPEEIISKSLGLIDDEKYREAIKNILAIHQKSVKAKTNYDMKGKLLRFGLSKGFESQLLYDLLNNMNMD